MNIHKQIKKNLAKATAINKKKTEAYKQRLEQQIRTEAQSVKPDKDALRVLANRYYTAKPQPFTQMQQAFEGAL